MKRKVLISTSLAVISFTALFNACKQVDTTPPIITLKGSYSMILTLDSVQPSDPGYTAIDNVDGSVTATSNWGPSNPNMNLAGTYYITYSATDKAGNTGVATRIVSVQNSASFLAGFYTDSLFIDSANIIVLDTVFIQTVTPSPTVNNKILFSMFRGYANDSTIYATLGGTTLDSIFFPMQTPNGIGPNGCIHIFSPNGSGLRDTTTLIGKYIFYLQYTDQEQVGGAGCPGYAAVSILETLTQQ